MTAPHAPREVTVWDELSKTLESFVAGWPKINVEPISEVVTAMTDSVARIGDLVEVALRLPQR